MLGSPFDQPDKPGAGAATGFIVVAGLPFFLALGEAWDVHWAGERIGEWHAKLLQLGLF